jgi:3-dehydroquinate synthase
MINKTFQHIIKEKHQTTIYLGENLLTDPGVFKQLFTQNRITGKRVFIITSPTIAKHYLAPLESCLMSSELNKSCSVHLIDDSETAKTLTQWQSIINHMAEIRLHRDSTVITLGGGVVGDIGGFAAASYQRGLNWIQIPTTLLAQVDASVGGKVAVNLPSGKNLVGSFYQPNAVLIDINTLKSLDARAYRAGLAEVLKAALIKEAEFFDWLDTHRDEIKRGERTYLSSMIERALAIKMAIVEEDTREMGIRALLNLGHSFAHALERHFNYETLLHGEAVAIGLHLAARLSQHLGNLTNQSVERILNLLRYWELPLQSPQPLSLAEWENAFSTDKKIRQDSLNFVLLKKIGEAYTRPVNKLDWQALFA